MSIYTIKTIPKWLLWCTLTRVLIRNCLCAGSPPKDRLSIWNSSLWWTPGYEGMMCAVMPGNKWLHSATRAEQPLSAFRFISVTSIHFSVGRQFATAGCYLDVRGRYRANHIPMSILPLLHSTFPTVQPISVPSSNCYK